MTDNNNQTPQVNQTFKTAPIQVNETLRPALTVQLVSEIYGYTTGHIHNLMSYGLLQYYNIQVYNRPIALIYTRSINAYARMQFNRRVR